MHNIRVQRVLTRGMRAQRPAQAALRKLQNHPQNLFFLHSIIITSDFWRLAPVCAAYLVRVLGKSRARGLALPLLAQKVP